jgi:alpha-acetolactate decarboxylase
MHVTKGPGSGHPPLLQETQKGDAIAGLVVGLYVAPQLVGVATHPGERTHSHWVSDDRTATAHLDAWGIKSGAVLLLPKP